MSNGTAPNFFEFDLGDFGGVIKISTPGELKDWTQKERNAWAWINNPPPNFAAQWPIQTIVQQHSGFFRTLEDLANRWAQSLTAPQALEQTLNLLASNFQEYYCKRVIFHSSSVEAVFLSKLKEKSGTVAAAGAYAMLLGNPPVNITNNPQFIEGMFEGLLFRRNVDWSGTANLEIFDRLKKEYESNLLKQENNFKEIEGRNANINLRFEETLGARTAALSKLETDYNAALSNLHQSQSTAFTGIIGKHEENLKAIELSYDQKLALQKPVEYWETKQRYHSRLSWRFGIAASVTVLLLAAGLGGLIYYVLSNLSPNQNPKSWQVGILLIALFFSIWIVRVLVRLLLSHLHLSEDAAERRTMILTYISMNREGSNFAVDDKRLILQHIFRSASDGLVKDDAAPPAPLELLSRKI